MSANLAIAQSQLLAPSGIALADLERVFSQALGHGIERADLYFQHSRHESWVLEDGIVKEGSHSIEQGVGVRAISGEKTGFAYSDEIVLPALIDASIAARAIARDGRDTLPRALQVRTGHALYRPVDPVDSMDAADKVSALRDIDALARSLDPRVTQVIVSIAGGVDTILVAASDGVLAADVRPLVRLSVQVIATAGSRREQGSSGAGGRYDYRELLDSGLGAEMAREAVRQAITNLEAVDAPAGTMQVVLGPGWPGVLLHEAVGHGLEGDFNRKGLSAFSGRMGQQVAARGVTVVDDGTLPGRRGSLAIDDEGTPTQRNVLIEDGVLTGYLQDRMNAGLMGVAPTGNGRRESYASLPMPRMTNTFMLAGDADPADLIRSVKRGLYAVNFGGGQVDITNGKFVFSASEAYLIEDGRVTAPVKGATLIGSGPETMTRIRGIGNDLALDRGIGVCGKDGQSVPVGVGQPTLLIDGLTVGGTRAG